MNIFLETKRLIIKPSTFEDLDNLCLLQADQDVMQYIGQGLRNPEEVRKWLEKSISHHQKHGFSFGSVFEKETGIFIGQAGIMFLDYDDTQPDVEIGYRLHKRFWNKGYATELSRELIKWGFKHLPVDKLVAVINPQNEKSRHVLEKVSMSYVGKINCYNSEVAKYEICKNIIEYNKILLSPASIADYPIIQNMASYYAYDVSEYMGWPQQNDGKHSIGMDFIKYWQAENTFPLIIKYQDELVGFVIIDKNVSDLSNDFNIAQFFILRKFKKKGIGRHIAFQCFDKFFGNWEVFVMPGNEGAYRFWRKIIKAYADNKFEEYTRTVNQFIRNVFVFSSREVNHNSLVENIEQSHEQMINTLIMLHYKQLPKFINRIAIGICNEVFEIGLNDQTIIVRMSPDTKFLMGSHDHIPKFKNLSVKVPNILAEDYSKKLVPLSYQIQNKIEGKDLGKVIENLTDEQLRALAKEIASIFRKVRTIPSSNQFGVIWGGGDNEVSDTWTERMKIWIDESNERGTKTGVMDNEMRLLADSLYTNHKSYFDSIKPITYYGDICSKNVMINDGVFSGLVDLDGLTQGDPLEAIGRIKLSWYGTHHGAIYSNAVMDELGLSEKERKLVLVYALFNKISWACENGIQFNQNTRAVVDTEKMSKDKAIINAIANELNSK
jgi:ribosomal-protein-alanine N-acetyltransferase